MLNALYLMAGIFLRETERPKLVKCQVKFLGVKYFSRVDGRPGAQYATQYFNCTYLTNHDAQTK